jgi:hypothetical protein
MNFKKLGSLAMSLILSLALASLVGCGSLVNTASDADPQDAPVSKLVNPLHPGDEYAGIEIFHATQDEPKYTPDNKGYLYDKDGWVYIHIEGSPAERGFQHGWLLADYIQQTIDLNSNKIMATQGVEWSYLKENALRMWSDKINPEYISELEGIVAGAKDRGATFDYGDLITWNGLEEITGYWLPNHINEYYQSLPADQGMINQTTGSGILPVPVDETDDTIAAAGATVDETSAVTTPAAASVLANTPVNNLANTPTAATNDTGAAEHCSAFIATGSYTTDGTIVLAHNTFTTFEDANFGNINIDITPDTGQHFAMQSSPGFIHSLSDIYTTETLLISETTIGGFSSYVEGGIPEFNRIRQAAQYATTLDDFANALAYGNNGGYANTWLVGQLSNNEIMQFELGLKFYNIEKSLDGAYAGFNAPLDARIRNMETQDSGFADIRRHQGARQVRIPQLLELNKGKIDTEVAKTLIADHYDVYLEKINPSSRTVCSHYELDKREYESDPTRPLPYQPRGAVDGTIVSSANAKSFTIIGRWGSSCGKAFDSTGFFKKHPQFNYLQPYIFDRASQPWTELTAIPST